MRTAQVVVVKSIADVALRATGFVTFPIIARRAGAEGYGAYTQANNIAAFVVPFASLGLSGAMVRFFASRRWDEAARHDLRRIIVVVSVCAGFVSPILFLAAGWLNRAVLGWPDGEALLRGASALVIAGALEQVALNFLRARDRLFEYSVYQIAQGAVLIVCVVVTLRSAADLARTVTALAIARALLACGALVIGSRPSTPPDSGPPVSSVPLASMVRYGFPVALSAIGLWIINLADRLVIGHFRSADELGRYGSVYTMAGLLAMTTAPFFLPAFGRLMRGTQDGDAARVAEDVSLFHRYSSIALVGGAVGLIVLVQPTVRLIGGDDFRVSGWLVGLLVAGLFVDQWNGLAHYILLCNDRTVFLQNAWLGAGAFNVATNLVAVPRFGIQGAAAMTLLTFALLNVVVYHEASKYVPLDQVYSWTTTRRAAVSSVVAGAPMLLLPSGAQFVPIMAGAGAYIALYIGMLFATGEVRSRDVGVMVSVLRPRGDPAAPDGGERAVS
jgi:O-antigen/teichoic acid export membrane protein